MGKCNTAKREIHKKIQIYCEYEITVSTKLLWVRNYCEYEIALTIDIEDSQTQKSIVDLGIEVIFTRISPDGIYQTYQQNRSLATTFG